MTLATAITAWHWPTHERWFDEGVRRSLAQMKAAGFTHVNWNCDAGYSYVYSPSELEFISEIVDHAGLKAWAIHGSNGRNPTTEVGGGCLEARKDFLSPHEWQRRAGVDLIRNRIHLAQAIGAPVVVMHFDLDPDVADDPDASEAYFAILNRSLNDLKDDCARSGVRIAAENLTQLTVDQTLSQFSRILETHEPDLVGICYDSGHAELAEKGGFRILEEFGDRLITTHLNDNRSVRDDHLLPGDGNVDWDRLADLVAASSCAAPFVWETPYMHHGMGYNISESSFFHRAHPLIHQFEEAVARRRDQNQGPSTQPMQKEDV